MKGFRMIIDPYNGGPERSPCGGYALFITRFGESHIPFEFMKITANDYIQLIRSSRERD